MRFVALGVFQSEVFWGGFSGSSGLAILVVFCFFATLRSCSITTNTKASSTLTIKRIAHLRVEKTIVQRAESIGIRMQRKVCVCCAIFDYSPPYIKREHKLGAGSFSIKFQSLNAMLYGAKKRKRAERKKTEYAKSK